MPDHVEGFFEPDTGRLLTCEILAKASVRDGLELIPYVIGDALTQEGGHVIAALSDCAPPVPANSDNFPYVWFLFGGGGGGGGDGLSLSPTWEPPYLVFNWWAVALLSVSIYLYACSTGTQLYRGRVVIRTGKPKAHEDPDHPVTAAYCALWRFPDSVASSDLVVHLQVRVPGITGAASEEEIVAHVNSVQAQIEFDAGLIQTIAEGFQLKDVGIFG